VHRVIRAGDMVKFFNDVHGSSAANSAYYDAYDVKPSPSGFSSNIPLTVEEMTSGSTDGDSDAECAEAAPWKMEASEAERGRQSPTEFKHVNRADESVGISRRGSSSDLLSSAVGFNGGAQVQMNHQAVNRGVAAGVVQGACDAQPGSCSEVGSSVSSPSDSKLNILCVASLFVEEQEMKKQEQKGAGAATIALSSAERSSRIPVGKFLSQNTRQQ